MDNIQQMNIDKTLATLNAALRSPVLSSKVANREDLYVREQDRTMSNVFFNDITMPSVITQAAIDQTSGAILFQDDPGTKTTQVLFSEFVNIFVSYPSDIQVWEEISAYEKACSQQVEMLTKIFKNVPKHHSSFSRIRQVTVTITGERNTWRLLGSLCKERISDDNSEDTTMDGFITKSDKELILNLYDGSLSLRVAQVVIDWLEKNSQDDSENSSYEEIDCISNTNICWENTLRSLKNKSKNVIEENLSKSHLYVSDLDPDASLRQGKPLHDLDQEEDLRLTKKVFARVRSGEISEAQKLCTSSGQHWRASILEGWKLHHDPNIRESGSREPILGNSYRDVWKSIAWAASSDERLPPYERATYGALCGNLEAMLKVCDNWEDQLWAHACTMVDQQVEEALRCNSISLRSLQPLPADYPVERLDFDNIFPSIQTRLRLQKADHFYHIIQKYIILDDIAGLIDTAIGWLHDDIIFPHLLRFLTHLFLVLQRFSKIPLSHSYKMTEILHECTKEAIERGDAEQVAWYTSVLPEEMQIRCYSSFLTNIHDDNNRKHALNLASLVGLNTQAISATVFANIRLTTGTVPSTELTTEISPEDRIIINAFDWLLFDIEQRADVLRQGNSAIRSFLLCRKICSAKALLNKIPVDSIDAIIKMQERKTGSSDLPTYYENRTREYLCYKTFLAGQESFTDWFEHYHQRRPQTPKKPKSNATFSEKLSYDHLLQQYNNENDKWKITLQLLSERACERLYNVLLFPDGGWLVDIESISDRTFENDEFWSTFDAKNIADFAPEDKYILQNFEPEIRAREDHRSHQMNCLRSIYIPQVTSLLQNILHCTNQQKECLQLVDLIASEQRELYKCFSPGEMQRFLLKFQETTKELLDRNMDALGYPLC